MRKHNRATCRRHCHHYQLAVEPSQQQEVQLSKRLETSNNGICTSVTEFEVGSTLRKVSIFLIALHCRRQLAPPPPADLRATSHCSYSKSDETKFCADSIQGLVVRPRQS